ncbi:MAG: aminotransferase class V-fold PLP-dependent enzyme [Thermohalobaculum sp.]|nr:aminotransferase class V-fold PLP-dependent enzyme [Thermohalobaculum sp.]
MAGRHFLQIPGPSNTPDRILRAMDQPVPDHRGPGFGDIGAKALDGMRKIFKTRQDVVIYPASGTGAWEAALVNTCSPGDRVLMYETGHFAYLWTSMAKKLGLRPEAIVGDWRHGADPVAIAERLRADKGHEIRAVCVVHNETSTGSVTQIAEIRRAIDDAGHPALLMVDTISGLASIDFRFDEWGIDVAVSGSQKGLMLPPGLSFNAVGAKAWEARKRASLPRSYWDWEDMKGPNEKGYFPYTPASLMLYGLNEAIDMLLTEGLDTVFERHARLAGAARAAVDHWGLGILCAEPRHRSNVLTAVMMPEGHSADRFRRITLDAFDMSLGNGLSKVADKVFRIGHLGDFNDLMLMGTLSGVEMGLELAGVPHEKGGVMAAMRHLTGNGAAGATAAA